MHRQRRSTDRADSPRRSLPGALLSSLALLAGCGTPSPPDTLGTPASPPAATVPSSPDPFGPSGVPLPSPSPADAASSDAPAPREAPDASSAADSLAASGPPAGSPPSTIRGRPRLRSAALREVSGLAVSRRDDDVLWAINDGGNAPALHAMTREGLTLGEWPVDAPNRDWEDLAALRLDGVPQLLIADTGDNLRRRDSYALHLVAEPIVRGGNVTGGRPLVPRRTILFRYEDGPHDVEAVGVDGTGGTAWLLTKEPVRGGTVSGGVYTLSLAAPDEAERSRVARRTATLAAPARGIETHLAAALAGIDLEQATAFDFSPDGTRACLLSYRQVRCFARADGESWQEALSRPGRVLAAHRLDQAEALALSADGRIWFTSEGIGAPIRDVPLR